MIIYLSLRLQQRLAEIILSIPHSQKQVSAKTFHKVLGELQSMSIALPGSQNLFSLIQIDLYKNSRSRIALHKGVHDALDKFRRINNDIYYRPTRIAELFPLLYSAKGYHYTSGLGAVGSLFSSPYLVPWEGFDM